MLTARSAGVYNVGHHHPPSLPEIIRTWCLIVPKSRSNSAAFCMETTQNGFMPCGESAIAIFHHVFIVAAVAECFSRTFIHKFIAERGNPSQLRNLVTLCIYIHSGGWGR